MNKKKTKEEEFDEIVRQLKNVYLLLNEDMKEKLLADFEDYKQTIVIKL